MKDSETLEDFIELSKSNTKKAIWDHQQFKIDELENLKRLWATRIDRDKWRIDENKDLRERLASAEKALEFYSDKPMCDIGEYEEILDWDRVNHFSSIQDRGKKAREHFSKFKGKE